ncbi:uncharacterized protein LOC116613259 isoform X1 [Nematostella vectensis]|uniref:uncharacterized protein LOC116613259 isoform X1 n=1 Tax=Nematostella vectensis TaxID=45351 RepID=UPI0020770F85|nr:uncharacterized protein LOC116613259 isoform X1 [Nematostella vectensis]
MEFYIENRSWTCISASHGDCIGNFSKRFIERAALATEVITVSLALLFYLLLLVLTALSVCTRCCSKLLSLQTTSIFFLVGGLMVSVNIFTNENTLLIKLVYRIAAGSVIGIAFMIVGVYMLFEKPRGCTEDCRPGPSQPCSQNHHPPKTLASQQPSMGLVVSIITTPLLIIELFLIFGTQAKTETDSYLNSVPLIMADKSIYMVQKFIQVVVYVAMRSQVIRENYISEAQFFFKGLAFFNVAEWLDSMVNVDQDLQLSKAETVYGSAFDMVIMLYKALVIDYRLLCALLFLEHAVEAEDESDDEDAASSDIEVEQSDLLSSRGGLTSSGIIIRAPSNTDRQYRNAGFVVGCLTVFVHAICLASNFKELSLGPWLNVFSVVVDCFVFMCGVLLIKFNDFHSRIKKYCKGMVIMVCCLGVVGLATYIIKSGLSLFWYLEGAFEVDYFGWVALKYFSRSLAAIFLMYLFAKVSCADFLSETGCMPVSANYFLVPALVMGTLSEFVGAAVDQYVGPLDNTISCVINETSLDVLFQAGPAMHLGFCLHVFLCFLILQTRMGRIKVRVMLQTEDERRLLLPRATGARGMTSYSLSEI